MRSMWPALWLVLTALLGAAQDTLTVDVSVTPTNWTTGNMTFDYYVPFNLFIGNSKEDLEAHADMVVSLLPLTSEAAYTVRCVHMVIRQLSMLMNR